MAPLNLHTTSESKGLAFLRILVAVIFTVAGLCKLVVPLLIMAFHEQLKVEEIPFHEHLHLPVPIMEMVIGYFLFMGKCTRFWSLVGLLLMIPAIYVHLQITDPTLFPMQPVMPIIVIGLCAVLVFKGAGNWNKDLDIFEK
jgi:uncharacterized membrane protein YphA (DoxX/SURF4 family)